jgi:polyhydroxyalkanoate synthase
MIIYRPPTQQDSTMDKQVTLDSIVAQWMHPNDQEEHGYHSFSVNAMDNAFKANLARLTLGISPAGLSSLYCTWLSHLLLSPGKQTQLAEKGLNKLFKSWRYTQSALMDQCAECVEPLPQDQRFKHPGWKQWPFNLIQQNFLLTQQWWHQATTDIDGLSKEDERSISFIARQVLDHYSPSNIPWMNPAVIEATQQTGGMNLWQGLRNLLDDYERQVSGKPPAGTEDFIPGKQVAATN